MSASLIVASMAGLDGAKGAERRKTASRVLKGLKKYAPKMDWKVGWKAKLPRLEVKVPKGLTRPELTGAMKLVAELTGAPVSADDAKPSFSDKGPEAASLSFLDGLEASPWYVKVAAGAALTGLAGWAFKNLS